MTQERIDDAIGLLSSAVRRVALAEVNLDSARRERSAAGQALRDAQQGVRTITDEILNPI